LKRYLAAPLMFYQGTGDTTEDRYFPQGFYAGRQGGTRNERGHHCFWLNGGFTVIMYGAQTEGGIDAVQLEFGSNHRQKLVLGKSAAAAGRAVASFYDAYLKDLCN
jgi:hypothetical protein